MSEGGEKLSRKEKGQVAYQRMLQGVGDVFSSDRFKETLEAMAKLSLCEDLNSEHKNTEWLLSMLKKVSPMPIRERSLGPHKYGYTDHIAKEIVEDKDLKGDDKLHTRVHEVTHACFHNPFVGEGDQEERWQKEVFAEAVTYLVCAVYGIETEVFSFGYIAQWMKENDAEGVTKRLADMGESIKKGAKYIITNVEELRAKEKPSAGKEEMATA